MRFDATLLNDQPPPRLRVYPRASVAAEKLEAIVSLGMINTRTKDYFDLRAHAREGATNVEQTADAVVATFRCRKTPSPSDTPLGRSDEFAHDAAKRAPWKAFLGRNRLDAPPLEQAIAEILRFVAEPLRLVRPRHASPQQA